LDYPAEFVEQLVGLSRSLAGDAGIALQRVADLAVEQLNGCDMAGVTLVRDGEPTTAVFTHEEAPEIDRAQYEADDGPCLDAYRNGVILRIDDTMDDDRWTAFASAAFSHGVRSTLSLPLRVEDVIIGALNLYSRTPHAFGDNEQMATVFVAHAAAALASAQAYSAAQALNEQLRTALASRAVIEQAKGVLMRDHECDAEHAFEMLKHASQHTNRKVRDVAVAILNDAIRGGKRSQSA
jgi:GAF domain-containing protein